MQGEQAVGEPCSYDGSLYATDDCNEHGACWNVNQEGMGTCHAFCMGSWEEPSCPEGAYCLIVSEGIPALCVPTCDPLAQDCGEGLGCYWGTGTFECIITSSNWALGEPCMHINDCAPGAACVAAEFLPACEEDACCAGFCALSEGDVGCAEQPGTSCLSFFEEGMALEGYEDVGICIAM